MIVCHCAKISNHDIKAAIDWMRAADPDTLITPRKIYRALGKTPECGGCMALFRAEMYANPSTEVPRLDSAKSCLSVDGLS